MNDDLKTDGSQEPLKPFMAQASGDLKTNEFLAQHEDWSDVGRKYIELNGKFENATLVPGDDATEEERASFFNKLGKPETKDGYELKDPDMPEGMELDKNLKDIFLDAVFEANTTKSAAQGIYSTVAKYITKVQETAKENIVKNRELALEGLHKDWGDKFKENFEKAGKAASMFGGEKYVGDLNKRGGGDSVPTLKAWLAVHDAIDEDKFIEGGKPKKKLGGGTLSYPEMD